MGFDIMAQTIIGAIYGLTGIKGGPGFLPMNWETIFRLSKKGSMVEPLYLMIP
ncbi:MAG: hypothetical protein U5N58_08440 [Actinomycetota bacterium]|nr:hypothetical protein [Actinomycetota bacterium]